MRSEARGPILRQGLARAATLLLLLAASPAPSRAQELEPRAYSPSPVGTTFLVAAYGHTSGDVLFEPSAPLSDVEAELNSAAVAYGRSFDAFSHAANLLLTVPYVWGDISGNVHEEAAAITRSGFGDPRLRLSVNLAGGTALTPAEFAQRTPQRTIGASLTVVPPLGQYDSAKLINISANRWAFKPELGISYPRGHWNLEGYAGVWFFTDNDEFFGGVRREQDPIAAFQLHVGYTFRPRLWLAFDSTWYTGGQSTVGGTLNDDRQSSTRVGLTLSLPLGKLQSLKFSWSEGATTRIGGDFTTLGVAWQHVWLPRPR